MVVDGAHNAYSMKKLIDAVRQYIGYERCFVIFGTSCDKDVPGMAQELTAFTTHITITSSAHPRAAAIPEVVAEFSRYGVIVTTAGNVAEALAWTLSLAKQSDLILITGSLFVVAEAIGYYQK